MPGNSMLHREPSQFGRDDISIAKVFFMAKKENTKQTKLFVP
jgi:hypothetical protein